MACEFTVALRSIEVVGVDGGKWLMDGFGGREDGMRGAPWLGASGGDRKPGGNGLKRLSLANCSRTASASVRSGCTTPPLTSGRL